MTNNEPPPYRSVMIHASAVEYRGKALVFLGPSETGKSTISQLLAATLEDVNMLADDKVDLNWQNDNGWLVSDAKLRFLKKSVEVQNVSFASFLPLKAIFRLYQAPFPQLKPIDTLKTGLYLLSAFFEINPHTDVSSENRRLFFAILSAVAKFAPGYEFYSDLSTQTVDLFYREAIVV